MEFDSTDIQLIKLLRKDARTSIAQLARSLQISPNAALHRYKKIQKSGIIKRTFIPVFLPKYVGYKNLTYKMQLIIRSELAELPNLIKFIKTIQMDKVQIECFETSGHFNIMLWLISENAIDLQVVKSMILSQKGVLELKIGVLKNAKDLYTDVSLEHLKGNYIYG